jgi:hypothetical protein
MQKSDYIGPNTCSRNLDVACRMSNGALVNINPSLRASPWRQHGNLTTCTACDLRAEQEYRRRLDLPDLLHQKGEASLFVFIVRLRKKASGLPTTGEKADEPVRAKALRRVRTGLQEQSVQVAPGGFVIFASCGLNFITYSWHPKLCPIAMIVGCPFRRRAESLSPKPSGKNAEPGSPPTAGRVGVRWRGNLCSSPATRRSRHQARCSGQSETAPSKTSNARCSLNGH